MDQVEYECRICHSRIMMETGFVMIHYGTDSHGFQLSEDEHEIP